MLKLISFAFLGFILWNLGRFIYLVFREAGMLQSQFDSTKYTGTGEKDITGKARIINEETKNDR